MTVVLDKILWSNLIGLWLDCQNFLSVMGRNKQVWNNAAPVATLQLKTLPLMKGVTGLNGWRQGEAFGNGNILLELNCQVQLWSFGEGILFRPALVLLYICPPYLSLKTAFFLTSKWLEISTVVVEKSVEDCMKSSEKAFLVYASFVVTVFGKKHLRSFV